jgi:hypothetical protein
MPLAVLIVGGGLVLHVARAEQAGSKRTDLLRARGHPGVRDHGRPPVKVKAGDAQFVPAGTAHLARHVGHGNGAELATYVVERGKPLITLVK